MLILLKSQILESNISDVQSKLYLEFRDFILKLIINYEIYKNDMNLEIIDELFSRIRSISDWQPPCSISNFEILKIILNFSDIIQYEKENPEIVNDYLLLITEFFCQISKNPGTKITEKRLAYNYFFNIEQRYRRNPSIFYKFLSYLYQSDLISTFISGDKKDFFKEIYYTEYKTKIPTDEKEENLHQLLIMMIIESYSKPEDSKELHSILRDSQPGVWTLKGILGSCIETSDKKERLTFSDDKKYIFEVGKKESFQFVMSMLEDCIWLITHKTSEFYSNEYQSNETICYKLMIKVFKDILTQGNIILINELFSQKSNLCMDLFLYKLQSNKNDLQSLITDVLNISFFLFQKVRHPFIFKLLSDVSVLEEETNEFLILILEKIIPFFSEEKKQKQLCNERTDLICMAYNLGNLIVLFFEIFEEKILLFSQEKFQHLFMKVLSFLPKSNLFYSKICFQVYNGKYYKAISEIIFDILYNLYLSTKKILFFDKIIDFFIINIKNDSLFLSTLKKNKNDYTEICDSHTHTFFFYVDSRNTLDKNKLMSVEGVSLLENAALLLEKEDEKTKVIRTINYSQYFLVKLLMYHCSIKDYEHFSILSNLLKFISNLCCQDLYLLKTKMKKNKPIYQENKGECSLYNEIKDIFEQKYMINKKFEDLSNDYELFIQTNLKNYDIYNFTKKLTISSSIKKNYYYIENLKNQSSLKTISFFLKDKSCPGLLLRHTISNISAPRPVIKSTNNSDENLMKHSEKNEMFGSEFSGDNISTIKNNHSIKSSFGSQTVDNNIVNHMMLNGNNNNNNNNINNNGCAFSITSSFLSEKSNNTNVSGIKRKFAYKSNFLDFEPKSFSMVAKDFILNPKSQLLLTKFSLNFKDIYFYNKTFEIMKKMYISMYKSFPKNKQLKFPSKRKNFINGLDPPMFLKQDLKLFDSKYFPISHSYFNTIKNKFPREKITFIKKILPSIKIENSFSCEKINYKCSIFGKMKITKYFFYFEKTQKPDFNNLSYIGRKEYLFSDYLIPTQENDLPKEIIFFEQEIKEIIVRRFLLMWQAVEILLKNGKSYFFNFFLSEKAENFLDKIESYFSFKIISDCRKEFSDLSIVDSWNKKKISTYDFLLYINKFASRSFTEPNQYPVFPWLLQDYSQLNTFVAQYQKNAYISSEKNNKVSQMVRNFQYPIICQTQEKREGYEIRYLESTSMKFRFHLGSHYSTSSYVYYYLMRMAPFTQCLISLQGDSQESANRMFYTVQETQNIIECSSDPRELIPEFFSGIEFFVNLNCSYFGKRRSGELVDDVQFQNEASLSTLVDFIFNHRNSLENPEIKEEIPKWINYIFGVNQLGGGEKACNIFKKETYAENMNLEKKIGILEKKYVNQLGKPQGDIIIKKIKDKINVIVSFGMTPFKLFEKEIQHKETLSKGEEKDDLWGLVTVPAKVKKSISFFEKNFSFFSVYRSGLYLMRKSGNQIEIEVIKEESFNNIIKNTKMEIEFKINCKPFKLFPIQEHSHHKLDVITYYYNPKYAFIILNNQISINGRNKDNTFSIHIQGKGREKAETRNVLCEDFVSSLSPYRETIFFSGLKNGKLQKWAFDIQEKKCILVDSIVAHKAQITAIEINNRHNIIATASLDNHIYIRKAYDFELLVSIKIKKKYIISYIKFSYYNCLYVMCYNPQNRMNRIIGYTLSGLKFAKSDYGIYYNFCFTQSGNLVVGTNDEDKVYLLKGSDLKLKESKKLIKKEGVNGLGWFEYIMNPPYYFLGYKNKDFYSIKINKEEDLNFFQ